MNFFLLLKTSLQVLQTNRRRTLLTTLGIIIGVAAVIVVMSVGAGAQSFEHILVQSEGRDHDYLRAVGCDNPPG